MSTLPTFNFRIEPIDYQTGLAELRSVREPVFVLEQKVPLELEWDALDPLCRHVIARDAQDRPIGTGRLTPEHKIGRLAVLPAWRGKGIGEALLKALIEQARSQALPEVTLNAQAGALGFYQKFGFSSYGERFTEAGIEHQAMRLSLAAATPGQQSEAAKLAQTPNYEVFEDLDATRAAICSLVLSARRDVVVFTRDLEPQVFGHSSVVSAFRTFATAGRGGVARFLIQSPNQLGRHPHALLALAQRVSSAFTFRTPQVFEELQYPSAFMANDHDGYLFRLLGTRYSGDWSLTLPSRNRQLNEYFQRSFDRSRACSELRALGI